MIDLTHYWRDKHRGDKNHRGVLEKSHEGDDPGKDDQKKVVKVELCSSLIRWIS